MFLCDFGVVLLVILCVFRGAAVADEEAEGDEEDKGEEKNGGIDRWVYWDVIGRNLSTYEYSWRPLDSSTDLSEFTAIGIKNFDGRHNFGQLETMLPNVRTLQLRHCDVTALNEAFAGKTLNNIKALLIQSDQAFGCPTVAELTPKFSIVEAFPLLERLAVSQHHFKTIPKQFAVGPTLQALKIWSAGVERQAISSSTAVGKR